MVEDASAEAFSRCFLRFALRRGSPRLLISDNGSNLVHFSKDLLSISDSSFTKDLLVKDRVEWKFIPVRSAFMGGIYERMIGLFKSVLKRSVGKKLLTLDELQTMVAYSEAACNDRPLYYVSRQDSGTHPLTPNMLVFGRNIRQCVVDMDEVDLKDPAYEFGTPGHLNKTCKRLKSTLLHFRKVWSQEYLLALRERDQMRNKNSPSTKYILEPRVGDVVVFSSGSLLKVGKILGLVPSDDGEVRKVQVESEGHVSMQAVVNLRHLESDGSHDVTHSSGAADSDDTRSDPSLGEEATADVEPLVARPRREAAVRAQQKWLRQSLLCVV